MQLPQESLKANIALFLHKQALKTTGNVNTILTMSIFNKQITPNSDIWGLTPTTTNYIKIGVDNPQQGRARINTLLDRTVPIS